MSRFFLYSLLWLGCFVLLSRALSIQEQSRQKNIEEEEFGHKHPSGTVYVIRHGEKPEDGSRGLSCLGHKRAKCVLSVSCLILFPVQFWCTSRTFSYSAPNQTWISII